MIRVWQDRISHQTKVAVAIPLTGKELRVGVPITVVINSKPPRSSN